MKNYVIIGHIWERNGYHDSDWYAPFWNREEKRIEVLEVGSTRFANSSPGTESDYPKATEEDLANAEAYLAGVYFDILRRDEDLRVNAPYPLNAGTRVRLTRDVRNREKKREECRKCNGSGHWVNPRNEEDKRPCFRCDGTGNAVVGKTGKMIKIAKGTAGEVISAAAYGSFYKNGYNKPNRDNTTVRVRSDDGAVWQAKADALRLDEEPASDEEIRAKAKMFAALREFSRYGSLSTLPAGYASLV